MRTNRRVPAGTVTLPPAEVVLSADRASVEATPPGALEAAGLAEDAAEDLPVKVRATTSLTRNTSTFPFISKRTCAAVPPRYLPFSTRPSLNSSVSAEAGKATANNATANARLASIQKRLIISPQDSRIGWARITKQFGTMRRLFVTAILQPTPLPR